MVQLNQNIIELKSIHTQIAMQILNSKTRHCHHHNGCLHDAIQQAIKQVKYGVIMAGVLQAFRSLRALLRSKDLFTKSLNKDLLSIIVFLSASTFILRIVRCALKKIRNKDDGLNSFIAGIAFGIIGTKTLHKSYWYIMLMFVASRIWGALYQYLLQNKYLDNKYSHLHYYLMFTFANSINSYGYFIEPDILKSDMYNLYDRMAMLTPNQKKWIRSSYVYSLKNLKQSGAKFDSDVIQQKIDKLTRQINKQ